MPDDPLVPEDPLVPDDPEIPEVPDEPPQIQPSVNIYSPKFAVTFTLPDTAQKITVPNGCKVLLTVVKQQSTKE